MFRVLVSLICLVLVACQGTSPVHRIYSGEAKPTKQIARLDISEKFNLLYIDSKVFESGLLSGATRLELLPGKHSLVLEYDEFWELNNEQHDRVTSKPVMIQFKVQAGANYQLQPAVLRNHVAAKQYAKKPEIIIQDGKTGAKLSVRHQYRIKDQRFLAEFDNLPETTSSGEELEQSEQMLRYWWRQAGYKQQNRFLDWAHKHAKRPAN